MRYTTGANERRENIPDGKSGTKKYIKLRPYTRRWLQKNTPSLRYDRWPTLFMLERYSHITGDRGGLGLFGRIMGLEEGEVRYPVGEGLYTLALKRGFSISSLAKKAQISRPFLSRYRAGKVWMSPESLDRLARALGYSDTTHALRDALSGRMTLEAQEAPIGEHEQHHPVLT